jgi:thiamine-monophosphate kinase
LASVEGTKCDTRLANYGVEVAVDAQAADDCAVLALKAPVDIVLGTDYVRGPKFHLYEAGFLSDRDIGRFCVTANASDLAAMGAVGVGFLSVVRYPKDFSDERFREVLSGIDEACEAYGLCLLGGDTGSAERLILSGSAVGVCLPGKNLRRNSARPGDVVAVTRQVGGAGAAVLASSAGIVPRLPPEKWAMLLSCWTGLNAQMNAGQVLASTGCRVACQDVSDGLRATANEIALASRVGILLDLQMIPLGDGVADVATVVDVDPRELAISASTDFCLCFTCSEDSFRHISHHLSELGVTAYVVGKCVEGAGVWTANENGEKTVAPGVEWKHQSGDIASVVLDGLRPDGQAN